MYNLFKSGFLILLMMAFMVLIGQAVGGSKGAMLFFFISAVMSFVSYFWSHKIVIMMYGAVKADPAQYAGLHAIVDELATRANLPKKPELYIVPMSMPNAFATGRSPSHAIVAVTEGLLSSLEVDEIKAVIAHEIGHIKHWDMLVSTIVAVMASAITMLLQFAALFGGRDDEDSNPVVMIAMWIFGSIAATLIQMAVSRSREYMADDFSAQLMESGKPLANALMRLHDVSLSGARQQGEVSPATAHMFIFPAGTGTKLMNLFSTHPSLEKRLANLEKFGR